MNDLLKRIKDMMMGTTGEYDTEVDYDYDEQSEYTDRGEEDHVRGYARSATRERGDLDYIGTKKTSKNSKIVDFHTGQAETKMQVMITYPGDVQDATFICDFVKENRACVVNLEGVDRAKAQRIADFLGGAAYAVGGEIQRISNEIFMVAPSSVHISDHLKEELTSGGHGFAWASSFK